MYSKNIEKSKSMSSLQSSEFSDCEMKLKKYGSVSDCQESVSRSTSESPTEIYVIFDYDLNDSREYFLVETERSSSSEVNNGSPGESYEVDTESSGACYSVDTGCSESCILVDSESTGEGCAVDSGSSGACNEVGVGRSGAYSLVDIESTGEGCVVDSESLGACSLMDTGNSMAYSEVDIESSREGFMVDAESSEACSVVDTENSGERCAVDTGSSGACSEVGVGRSGAYSLVDIKSSGERCAMDTERSRAFSLVDIESSGACSEVDTGSSEACSEADTEGSRAYSLVDTQSLRACSLVDTGSSGASSLVDSGGLGDYCEGDIGSCCALDTRNSLVANILLKFEKKIDALSDLSKEHCRLLQVVKEEMHSARVMVEECERSNEEILARILQKTLMRSIDVDLGGQPPDDINSPAKTLLDALHQKRAFSLEREIIAALTECLQSEDLKERIVNATAKSVKGVVQNSLRDDVSSLYLPRLQRAHQRMHRQVAAVLDHTFKQLENKTASITRSIDKSSSSMRRALDKHESLLYTTSSGQSVSDFVSSAVKQFLEKELKQWREKVLHIVSQTIRDSEESPDSLDNAPLSPPQPADPKKSILDTLMKSIAINKLMKEGDVNGAFASALAASDLVLVMAACRAADPARVFSPPCQLQQPVLLSLLQQLATDLVHDTQLKCRYMEEAIISLNPSNPVTRSHLPLVMEDVQKHLKWFLVAYPSHVAATRIKLIMMAANNLLK